MTTARWLREQVLSHPDYQHDSVVSDAINYDIVNRCSRITSGEIDCPELLIKHKSHTQDVIPLAMQKTDEHLESMAARRVKPHTGTGDGCCQWHSSCASSSCVIIVRRHHMPPSCAIIKLLSSAVLLNFMPFCEYLDILWLIFSFFGKNLVIIFYIHTDRLQMFSVLLMSLPPTADRLVSSKL